MNFEQIPEENLIDKKGEQAIPKEESTEKETIAKDDRYKKAREQSDFFLKSFDFVKEEEIIEIKAEKPKDKTPVFFSPGWGVTETSKTIMKAMADEGRDVLSTFYTRERQIKSEDIPGAELQKAFAIIEIISKKEIDKIDAVGHSEGGLALALAASIRPDLFRNIVLIAPAGMMEKDSFFGLIGKFFIKESWEEKKGGKVNMKAFLAYLKDASMHALKNPLLSIEEVLAMNKMDLFEMTKYVKSQGVGVGLVCGANDRVFPLEEVLKNVNEGNIDHFLSTKGDHGSIEVSNEQTEYVSLATELLADMAKEKK